MSKRLSLLLVVVMVFALASTAAAKTTLDIWVAMTNTDYDAFAKLVEEYERLNPDIDINPLQIPTGETNLQKLLTAIAGGTAPDAMVYFDRFNTAQWAAQGALMPITRFIEQSSVISADDYYPAAWDEVNFKGDVYGLPFETDARGLFYNKGLFREAGLDPERPPRTWEELEAMNRKLTKKNAEGGYDVIGFIPWENQGWLYTWGWLAGGEFYDPETRKVTLTDPNIVRALQWQVDFAKEYDVTQVSSFQAGFGTMSMNPFVAGKLAMIVTGPWDLVYFRQYNESLDFGVAPLPYPENGGVPCTWAGGHSNIIPRGAKHPEEAYKFLEWLSTGDQLAYWNLETNHIPTIRSVAERKEFVSDPLLKVFIDMLPNAKNRPVIPVGQTLWDQLVAATEKARYGQATPLEALREAERRVNNELRRIRW